MLPNPITYHIHRPGSAPPDCQPCGYVIAQNGVFKVADTPHFHAGVHLAPARIAGLAPWPGERRLNVPRIPARWLRAVLDHAQCAGRGGGILRPVEQMYHFHWCDGAGWRVAVPKQNASAGHVGYRGGHEAGVVLDLHSHHGMAAYFSEVDDRDELGCRYYAVIGRIYDRPEIRVRLGIYGDRVEVPATEIFESLGPFVDAYDGRTCEVVC